MSLTLVVHPQDFSTRVFRNSSDSKVIFKKSLIEGVSLLMDPNVRIQDIYFSPNDSSYSALQFIELALLHRPVTPLFMIHSGSPLSQPIRDQLDQLKLQGVYSEHDLPAALNQTPLRSYFEFKPKSPLSPETVRQHFGYLPVPMIEFQYARTYPFDVFIESKEGKLSLFATSGSPIVIEYLSKALEEADWFYIHESCIKDVRNQILKIKDEIAYTHQLPDTWKHAETIYKAKALLHEIQSDKLSDAMVGKTHEVLSDVFHLLNQIQTQSQSDLLDSFIEETMNSNRSIACATLSILMCKSLRFEKNAIVEILGIASVLQDIALYHSPFGNLTNKNPLDMSLEEKNYYQKHPQLSADLIAKNTSVPDVTLQVIRQHHERKDRTGFPGKIGGMQLHPMAEILSLINEMIDQDPQSTEAENEILKHYSERVVAAYRHIHFRKRKESSSDSTRSTAAA